MNINALPSEIAGVVGIVDPDAYAVGAQSTGWIDAAKYHAFLAIVMAGDLGTLATITAKLEQATTSGGAGAKDVPARAITTLTKAGTDDNKQALINVRPEDLDIANRFRFFRLTMAVTDAASDAAGLVLGFYPRNGPATDNDLTVVDEVIGN